MQQAGEVERVKQRIKALTEKTVANGCTEAEAMAAAAMVGRLLERYALSMDEIEVRQSRCVQATVPLGGVRRRPIDACVPTIARFCDCKVWLAAAPVGKHYVFFGFETDTALATYLFAVVQRAMETELAGFHRANPALRAVRKRQAGDSFQFGLAARVSARLDEIRDAREAAVRCQRATGTALILAKHRVVDEAFAETKVRLVASGGIGRRRIASAYKAGWHAGDRVNLTRPVGGGGGSGARGLLA